MDLRGVHLAIELVEPDDRTSLRLHLCHIQRCDCEDSVPVTRPVPLDAPTTFVAEQAAGRIIFQRISGVQQLAREKRRPYSPSPSVQTPEIPRLEDRVVKQQLFTTRLVHQ